MAKLIGVLLLWTAAFALDAQDVPRAATRPPSLPPPPAMIPPPTLDADKGRQELAEVIRAQTAAIKELAARVEELDRRVKTIEKK